MNLAFLFGLIVIVLVSGCPQPPDSIPPEEPIPIPPDESIEPENPTLSPDDLIQPEDPISEIEDKVWVILRPITENGIPTLVTVMGTGFFIAENKFITAHHVIDKNSLSPDVEFDNNFLILFNTSNERIDVYLTDVLNFLPNKDITIINIDGNHEFFECEESFAMGDSVYNLGYPFLNADDLFEENPIVNQKMKGPLKQEGKIIQIVDLNLLHPDLVLIDTRVIILNHGSEQGYSGGPLLSKNNKIVGMISFVFPVKREYWPGKVVAIGCNEFPQFN